ncbi:MAG: DUF4224 domain-containing protein [Gammaproteobacteria bacterium]|nr:DUF4224 domain-containing protein [Gammaproteobacteria bacterium]
MFLSDAELQELTGAVQAAKQRQVLDRAGIFYVVRLDGTIRTTWHHVNHPMNRTASEPDWAQA